MKKLILFTLMKFLGFWPSHWSIIALSDKVFLTSPFWKSEYSLIAFVPISSSKILIKSIN